MGNNNEEVHYPAMKGVNAGFHLRSVDLVSNDGNPEFGINAIVNAENPLATSALLGTWVGADTGNETRLPEYLKGLTKAQWVSIIQKFNECYDDAIDINNSSRHSVTSQSLVDNMRQLRELIKMVNE